MMGKLDLILNDLETLHVKSRVISDKRTLHSYIKNIYEPMLDYLINPKIVLEIGVLHGVSLAMWSWCFPNSKIIAADILLNPNLSPAFKELVEQKKIELLIGDAYSPDFLTMLPEQVDLMIDDGPHTLESQIRFLSYRKKLAKDGILVIEDIKDGANSIRKLLSTLKSEEKKQAIAVPLMYRTGRYDDLVLIYSKNVDVINFYTNSISKMNSILISSPILFALSKPYIFLIRCMCYLGKKINQKSLTLS